jgi:hypothetical protein
MDWVQALGVTAFVSALMGAAGKTAGERLIGPILTRLSPTLRLKKAEEKAKADAPPPLPPPPQFVIPVELAVQAKHVELVQLRDELTLAQEALRRLRREHDELALERTMAHAARQELETTQAALRKLRETCDAQAFELAKMSGELQLARANGARLAADNEKLRAEGPPVYLRPDEVRPEFRVERIRTRGGATATPQISERIKGEGKSNG